MQFSTSSAFFVIVCAGATTAALACRSFSESGETPADGGVGDDATAADAQVHDAGRTPDAGPCELLASPTVLASTKLSPTRLVTDGEFVYWIDGTSRLARVALVDCTVSTVVNGNITALAVGSQHLVWGAPTIQAAPRSNVFSGRLQGSLSPHSSMLVVNGDAMFVDPATDRLIGSAPPFGSSYVVAELRSPRLLASNGALLFSFGVHPDGGTQVELWSRSAFSASAPQLTGPLAEEADPRLLAATSARVFWVTPAGVLRSVRTDGSQQMDVARVPGVTAIAVDEDAAYLATDTAIVRAAGSMVTTIAKDPKGPISLVVTSDQIIWANSAEILRVKK